LESASLLSVKLKEAGAGAAFLDLTGALGGGTATTGFVGAFAAVAFAEAAVFAGAAAVFAGAAVAFAAAAVAFAGGAVAFAGGAVAFAGGAGVAEDLSDESDT
jgi:hypothetical protein